MVSIMQTCQLIKTGSRQLALSDINMRNQVLIDMACELENNSELLLTANNQDIIKAQSQLLSLSMLDRLKIDQKTIQQMQLSLKQVAQLDDPLIESEHFEKRPNGIRVSKKKIPLGVILMIYESRPNVTVEAAALAIKSGNAIILKGGKESINSNRVIAKCWKNTLRKNSLDESLITLVDTADRNLLTKLLKLDELIDVVIPRGGEGLIQHVVEHSRIPVIKHYRGVCHLYIDESADLKMALELALNGKTQRPGVCNAIEGLVVHQTVARDLLPSIHQKLSEQGVEIYGCEQTRKIIPDVLVATDKEFATEFLALKISIKVVDSIEEAISFIERYGSQHTEVIVTRSDENAERFIREVDASVVMVNASSRFSDGGELGLGAEIGISTSKIHAYGPMGLNELTSEKFVVKGDGQIRS